MKTMYTILLNGEIIPDMHVLLFQNRTVALYSYLLLSIAYARNDLVLYEIGSIDNYGVISNTNRVFVTDIHTIMSKYDEYCQNNDEKNVSRDLFVKSLEALNVAIKNKLNVGVEDEQINK